MIFSHVLQALRVSDDLQAGTIFVNTYNKTDVAAPFGGFKQSGFGKDLGKENLQCHVLKRLVIMQLDKVAVFVLV